MPQSTARQTFVAVIAIFWQVIVWILSCCGIFGDIYWVLGIPWNSTGWINVVGTTIGLCVLELPFVLIGVWILRRPVESPDDWLDKLGKDHRPKP